MKLRNFCRVKKTFNKFKRKVLYGIRYLQMIYPKGDLYSIIWEVLPLNIKGTNNLIKTWGKILNRHLSKGTQMANRNIKKKKKVNITNYWGSADQSDSEVSPHSSQLAIFKKSKNNKCWTQCGKRESLYTVGRNVSWYNHYGKQYESSLKKN